MPSFDLNSHQLLNSSSENTNTSTFSTESSSMSSVMYQKNNDVLLLTTDTIGQVEITVPNNSSIRNSEQLAISEYNELYLQETESPYNSIRMLKEIKKLETELDFRSLKFIQNNSKENEFNYCYGNGSTKDMHLRNV